MGARTWFVAAGLLILLAACEPVSAPTSTTLDLLPPPDLNGSSTSSSTTTSLIAHSTSTSEPLRITYQGVLPNGTNFRLQFPDQVEDTLMLVQGSFNVRADEALMPVGEVRYTRVLDPGELGYLDGTLRLWADPWLIEVMFDEATRPDLSVAPFGVGIELATIDGFPVLDLDDPYTWEGSSPQLRYVSFVVATGCWPEAVRCTDNHAVQVISADDIFIGGAGLSELQVEAMTLSTSSLRQVRDPNYLDPGPLTMRNSASVIWTGEEMLVWGGKEDRDGVPNLVDGAAFNPETGEWRMLAPIPLDRRAPARAIWADDEMVVITGDGTFGYDALSDRWREIGQGSGPVEWNGRLVYLDGYLYLWDRAFSMHRMDLDVGMWETIAAPDDIAGFTEAWAGVLRVVSDRLIAITLNSACQGKGFWQFTGKAWQPLPSVSLATPIVADCSIPAQSAAVSNDLFIWDDLDHPTMGYKPFTNAWRELPPAPLGGSEGAGGGVVMDAERFMVPEWDHGAIFDARTETWTEILLPGVGSDAEIIWTGEELLAWGVFDSFDAWRFTPPSGPAGGADTS
jgi:hypothetical protein